MLTREPDFDALPRDVPPQVRQLLERCLRKDTKTRLRDIGDVQRNMLLDQRSGRDAEAGRRWLPWMVAAALGLGLLAHAGDVTVASCWRLLRGSGKQTSDDHAVRFLVPRPEKASFGTYDQPVLSPDGKLILFTARTESGGFFVHSLDTAETRHIPGPEVFGSAFWSPDNRFVAFYSGGVLKRVDLQGGPVSTICDAGLGFRGRLEIGTMVNRPCSAAITE